MLRQRVKELEERQPPPRLHSDPERIAQEQSEDSKRWIHWYSSVQDVPPSPTPQLVLKIADRKRKVPEDDEGYPKATLLWKLRMVRKNAITFHLCTGCADLMTTYIHSHTGQLADYAILKVFLCMECAKEHMVKAECGLIVKKMKDETMKESLPNGSRLVLRSLMTPPKGSTLTIQMCRKCDELNFSRKAEYACVSDSPENSNQKLLQVPILLCRKCCFESMLVTECLDPLYTQRK